MRKTIKIALFTRYEKIGASSRLRFFQFLPALEQQFKIDVFPLLGDEYLKNLYSGNQSPKIYIFKRYMQRFCQLIKVGQYDLIWIEKELFPNLPYWVEGLSTLIKKTYVVDYDDAIFHNYDLSQNLFKKILSSKIDKVMSNATLVTAGNSYIANRAVNAGARWVERIPTVIDIHRYAVKEDITHKSLVIGWIGSPSTIKYLCIVIPIIKRLAKNYNITLVVIGAKIDVAGVKVVCVPWQEETEVTEIQKFDIGIMPLTDSPWERGKCGYKLIQYMACGIPVIASPVGVNLEIVEASEAGFLASSEDDWLKAFEQLLTDEVLREKLGKNGRKAVENTYTVQVVAPKLNKLLSKLTLSDI